MGIVADVLEVVNHDHAGRWNRTEQTKVLDEYKAYRLKGATQRDAAKKAGAPRSTLEAWMLSGATLDSAPEVTAFFESTHGLCFLHRLMAGLHTVFVEISGCGIRSVCEFLKLVSLDRFVASSYEAQGKYNVSVEEAIVAHGTQERERLSETMAQKDITVAQDETFTGGLTLVAIEPESGFILLEKLAQARDTPTWDAQMKQAMQGLKCDIIQSTSDEAKALISYAENTLGAHHSPDLFHVQQEMTRAVSAPISA